MASKSGSALVIGAGISGIRSAIDLAETGYQVYLVDKAPHIGGILEQLDRQFPTNRCGMCKMLPAAEPDQAIQQCLRRGLFHDNIEVLTAAEVTDISGEAGNFSATLHQPPALVDPNRCAGCGDCAAACPVEVKDDFNAGLSTRKAIYRPAPQMLPGTYVIDLSACTHCGECVPVCPTGAIRMATADREKFRVLVVDDELIVRDSLRALLTDEGFFADMAESGEEALEKLKADTFHLMLLDIKMPGMEGVDVLKEALILQPELRVVMMTAYATIETAVESMKIGAVDYLVKPFEETSLLPQIYRLYEESDGSPERVLDVGAVVISAGCRYFNPADEKDVFGYGVYPDVVTHLEFERLISGTGPFGGQILRPSDRQPVKKIAWIQCVGSRDLQTDSDFCSSICCMSALKEAMLAREMSGGEVETVIFYMDMRVFEKPFQQYLDEALDAGVMLKRCRVHSVSRTDDDSPKLMIRYVDAEGAEEGWFDLVVLSVGQRAADSAGRFSEMLELDLNQWGYLAPRPFSLTRTAKPGVFLGGAVSGLTDINDAVIRAQAAACGASLAIHRSGGSLEAVETAERQSRDISREMPSVLIVLCTCGGHLPKIIDMGALFEQMQAEPAVARCLELDQLCTDDGWMAFLEEIKDKTVNRILLATCSPNAYAHRRAEIAEAAGLPEAAVQIKDIYLAEWFAADSAAADQMPVNTGYVARNLKMAVSGLKRADLTGSPHVDVYQSALVIGGGIAGMTAALSIADHGFQVDLVEKTENLGGNLNWLTYMINGTDVRELLEKTIARVNDHSLINVHLNASVSETIGTVGRFQSKIREGDFENPLSHGAMILATGGVEAETESYGHGKSGAVMTQKAFETARAQGDIDPANLSCVAMIQCADCREAPRNYCSRICCISALKHALYLKQENPEISVYILYRDMMTPGFYETYYTRARQEGVIFFPYTTDAKPEVLLPEGAEGEGGAVQIKTQDPILGQEVQIDADLLLLATGIRPVLPDALLPELDAGVDAHGFFKEADFKWRPVESLAAGVFACGLALSPRAVDDSMASAEAAAMRAVRMISRQRVNPGQRVAVVRHSLCSACQLCISACPYGARAVDPETGEIVVHAIKCQGCGACAAVCPNSATILSSGSELEMFEMIDAAMESL
ncbi:MAG: response regulator [Desulfobacterales bacterium]